MLINCPKCNSIYNISDDKVSTNGKKFKCAECECVWKVYPEDVIDDKNVDYNNIEIYEDEQSKHLAENLDANFELAKSGELHNSTSLLSETEEINIGQKIAPAEINNTINTEEDTTDIDITEMFNRLSQDTKGLFTSNSSVSKMSVVEQAKHNFKNNFNPYPIVAFLLVLIVILSGAIFYFNRFDITAYYPKAAKIYNRLHLDSIYKGKDLIFQNVQLTLSDSDDGKILDISGRLYNNGTSVTRILPVKVTLLANNGIVLLEEIEDLPDNFLEPHLSVLFHVVIKNMNMDTSNVKLSLVD